MSRQSKEAALRKILVVCLRILLFCCIITVSSVDRFVFAQEADSFGQQVNALLRAARDEGMAATNMKKLFTLGEAAVPYLVKSLEDSEVAIEAARALCFIGNQEGIVKVEEFLSKNPNHDRSDAVRYFLRGTLVDSANKDEVNKLFRAVASYEDGLGEALMVLAVSDNPASLEYLEKAYDELQQPQERPPWFNNHLNTLKTIITHKKERQPAQKTFTNDEEAIKATLHTNPYFLRYSWAGPQDINISQLVFNPSGDSVLVTESEGSGEGGRGHTVVLKKTAGSWKIIGIWLAWQS